VPVQAWRAFGIVAAIVLYAVSQSGDAYELTSPHTLPYHEIVRKTYALLAFALLGYALERSKVPRVHGAFAAAIVLGVYSYAIELGQISFGHAQETFAEHAFDVASGVVGGALGALAARPRRTAGLAVAAGLVLLAWEFTLTYGSRAP